MDGTFPVHVGLNTKDHDMIQDLIYYTESRFQTILHTIDNLQKEHCGREHHQTG
jgi:hypothetical protein